MNKKIALIIPCYNEGRRLKYQNFNDFIDKYKKDIDCYFVDDGSTDDTCNIIELQIMAKNPNNVSLIKSTQNEGKAKAIRKGMLCAVKKDYEMLGFIDADLQIPLSQIEKIAMHLSDSKALLAISTRELRSKLRINKPRTLLSLLFVEIANYILKFNPVLSDTQCGCKIFRKEIIEASFQEEFYSKWLFDLEILLRLKTYDASIREKIIEIKLPHLNESVDSKFKIYRNLNLIKELWRINRCFKN